MSTMKRKPSSRQLKGKRLQSLLLFCLFAFLPSCAQYNIDRVIMAGRSALYYEDYVLSIQYFNQVITAKPYLYEPWYFRALAKYNLDDYLGAENDCTEAISLNPYVSTIYELRGVCRIRQQKYSDAATDYDKAIANDPMNMNLWYNRALCRIQDKDFDKANFELDSMMNRWKTNAKIYQLKAEVCMQQRDTVEASAFLDRSLELDPYDGEAWTVRAMISLSRKKWKDADQQLGKAIHLKPSVANNYVNRALARYNINNLRGAMADYDKAIELDPNNFLAHYNRGQLRVQVGDDNRAIDDFDFIINLEPNNIMAIFNRALLLDRTGNLRAAIRDYSRVIEEFPNFWTGLQYRARCYRRLGMTAQAEMDEFRVFKAQMDKHLGIQPRWGRKKSREIRKQSDIDMNKYNQLVEADEQVVEHEYNSAYRGKVQNRKVEDELMPMYVLSYRRYTNGVKRYTAYDNEVEAFNRTSHPRHAISITCNQQTLNEGETRAYFMLVDSLTADVAAIKDLNKDKALLIHRAIAYSVVQNFDAAINDLTAYVQTDSTLAIAYWQRGVCQALMNEFTQSQGIDSDLRAVRTQADFDEAIKLSPNNPYLYYDRATLHAMRRQYQAAIDDYTRAIALDSDIAEAYFNRGLVRIYSGNKAEGLEDLSKAGELGLFNAYGLIKKYKASKDRK